MPTADGAGRITWEAQSGGAGGTVTTSAPVSGDGSAGDPVTIANQAIDHTKIGSTVAGVDQAAGRILEADGAGDVRWADQSAGGGGDDQVAAEVPVGGFTGNLSGTDTDVQTALDTIDGFTLAGGGGGGAEVDAVDVTYAQATRVLSVSVQQDNNADFVDSTTLPTPSENHAGLLELATTGEVDQGIIRGVAIDPVTLAHGFTSHRSNTVPASTGTAAIGTATRLARADHDHGDGYELAQADAEDRASTVFGQVSGERLAQATAVDEGVAFDVDDFPLRADIIGTRDRSRVHVVVPDDGSGNPDRNAVPVEIGHLQATDAHELTMTVGGHAGYRDPSLENFGGSYGSISPNDWVAINILTVATNAVELDFQNTSAVGPEDYGHITLYIRRPSEPETGEALRLVVENEGNGYNFEAVAAQRPTQRS